MNKVDIVNFDNIRKKNKYSIHFIKNKEEYYYC